MEMISTKKEASQIMREMYWYRLWRPKEWGWVENIKAIINYLDN